MMDYDHQDKSENEGDMYHNQPSFDSEEEDDEIVQNEQVERDLRVTRSEPVVFRADLMTM
jgi:hypothetical protein